MDLDIKGRTALVLSAGGGLGSAVAVALAREGVHTYLADINQKALDATKACVQEAGGEASTYAFDLSSTEDAAAAVTQILADAGGIDILFNNTGGPAPGPAHGQLITDWQKAFASMVLPVISITDMVLPKMREKRWGRIITSTSSGVVAPIPNLGLSNTARTSLLGWSKTLARDVAGDGITVNVLVPGRIGTARVRFLDGAKALREKRDIASVEAESAASIPIGRYGRADEYADAALFLASERASYITGTTLRVDGGLIASL